MYSKIYLYQAAEILGISAQTLRRWDKSGVLPAQRTQSNRLFYYESEVEDFLSINPKYFFKTAENWTYAKNPQSLLDGFYCPDRSIFKARLSRFEFVLKEKPLFENIYSLIVAVAGEIGNNSFDHNLGNWPDVNGIFFGYNLQERTVILSDRGQGILATLKRVNPSLITYQEALKAAFTEIISGRAPENRGNGLKFVRSVVKNNGWGLVFQSGDAVLSLDNNDENLTIKNSDIFLRGCFAKLIF